MTLTKMYEASKVMLSFIKLWFKILAQTDTGRDFIQGISEQVQMIYNKTFMNETPRYLDMDWDDTKAVALEILIKHQIKPKRAEQIVNNMLSFDKQKIKGMRLKENEKAYIKDFQKLAKRYAAQDNSAYGKALDGWLARMMEGADRFDKDFIGKKEKEVFVKSAFRVIKMVFLNTKIRVDTLQPNWDTKKKISVVEAIKGLRMLKDKQTINVAFTYNNNTQYGDNDTYNQWINNVNILSTHGMFKDVNWDALEKNAILIDAKFKQHQYKEPKYLSDYK